MQSRSVARELALLMLGQISDRQPASDLSRTTPLDALLLQALASLSQHVREALDQSATDLEQVLHRQVLDYAEKNYKKYFEAPKEYAAVRSISSLEYYAEQQKPQPPK